MKPTLPPIVSNFTIVKNLPKFVKNPIPILDSYIEDKGPTFAMNMSGLRQSIITTEPDFIQYILQKNNKNFKKSAVQTKMLAFYVGKGLLTSEGEYWLKQRRLIQPGFHRKKLANLVTIMNEVITNFIKTELTEAAEKGEEVDMFEKMMELAFVAVAKSLFSSSVTDEELHQLSTTITEVQSFLVKQVRLPFLHYWFKWSGQIKKHRQQTDEANLVILKLIKERRESGEHQDDLLDMLLESRYEDTGEGMTDKQLLEEALILFVAGHETSANALAWTWYILAQHPEAVAKIRQELDVVLGGRLPAFEDLPQLDYLRQVIDESMRLYPPAWITDRIAVEDDSFNGFHIPKGAYVVPYIHGVHHSKDLWDDPAVFRPERFEKAKKKARSNFAYMPFGGGPRLCIGNNFAMMEMQLVIAQMIRQFDMEIVEGQTIRPLPLVTLRPEFGIKMRLTKTQS